MSACSVCVCVCVCLQVTSGDNMLGPEGVEISLKPVANGEDAPIRYVHTTGEGRYAVPCIWAHDQGGKASCATHMGT